MFLYSSCTKTNTKPLLPEETFIQIMTDIHLLEAQLDALKQTSDTFFYAAKPRYDSILLNHGASMQQLKTTFEFYLQHPKLLDMVYEKIVDTLSEQQALIKE